MASYLFGFAGQSNAHRHFDATHSGISGVTGAQRFASELESYLGLAAGEVVNQNTAVGGSGASNNANPSSFWWNVDTDSPGALLTSAISSLQSAAASNGVPVTGIIWAQGEEDAEAIGLGNTTVTEYIATTQKIFDYFRAQLGNPDLQIFIQQTGDISRDDVLVGGGAIREAQQTIAAADPDVHIAAQTYDLGKADTLHFNAAGYHEAADRLALSIADNLNTNLGLGLSLPEDGAGPSVQSAVVQASGDQILVTLDMGDAAGFSGATPASGIDGFIVTVDGFQIDPTSITRQGTNEIVLDFDSPLFGDVAVEYALESTGGTGSATGYHTANNTVEDANGLPLEAFAIDATGTVASSGSIIRQEAESTVLSNMVVQSAPGIASGDALARLNFVSGTSGTMTSTFNGPAGTYAIGLGFFDESDGTASLTIAVNGVTVGTLDMDRNVGSLGADANNFLEKIIAPNVSLNPGDTVTLTAQNETGEWGRTDFIDYIPIGVTGGPSTIRVEMESMSLTNLETEARSFASNGLLTRLSTSSNPGDTGTATTTFSGQTGTYTVVVGYHDESDGEGTFQVHQNAGLLGSLVANEATSSGGATAGNFRTWTVAQGITINNGDSFDFSGIRDGDELMRLDYVEFIPSSPGSNNPPTATNNSYSTDEDATVAGNVVTDNTGLGVDSDPDTDPLTVTEVNGAGFGGGPINLTSGAQLTMSSTGAFTYDPNGAFDSLNQGQSANDSFTYTISDGNGGTDTATVNLTIDGVGGATGGTIRVETEFMTLTGLETENRSFASNGQVTRLPTSSNPGDTGTATTTFTGQTGTYDVILGYHDENDGEGTFQVHQNANLLGSLVANEATSSGGATAGNFRTWTVAQGITINNGDTFDLSGIRDGDELMRLDYIEFVPAAPGGNNDPTATNNSYTTDEDDVVAGNAVTDNTGQGVDNDPDGDPLTVTDVNGAAFGGGPINLTSGAQLTMSSTGAFTYDPNGAFDSLNQGQTGNDSFTYTIDDGNGGTDTATVSLAINGVGGTPGSGPIRIEMETMTLTNFETEARSFASNGQLTRLPTTSNPGDSGTATTTFTGQTGTYDIIVRYHDENDGAGTFQVLQNSSLIGSVVANSSPGNGGPTSANGVNWTVAQGVTINNGDTFDFTGIRDGDELMRLDYVEFVPSTASVVSIEAEDMTLTNMVTEARTFASNGALARVDFNTVPDGGTATAETTFNGASGVYDVTVDYHDENDGVATLQLFQDEVLINTLTLDGVTSSAGASAANAFTWEAATNLTVTNGDTFELVATRDDGELVRIDKIDFTPDDGLLI